MTTDTPEVPVLPTNPTAPAKIPKNYWGADETTDIYLDDEVQYFTVSKMNEGARAKFEKLTNQDIVIDRNQESRVKMDPASERHSLIMESVVGWHMYEFPTDGTDPYLGPFSKQQLRLWLEKADPKVVNDLEYKIRMFNPWMLRDMPVDEIDKEIERLNEMRKKKIEEEAGEATSATK